jgi:hypothetical protein
LADRIAAFSPAFFAGSVASASAPSQARIAAKISFSRASCIFDPATRLATFCSSMTFQLMKASMSG